jgi:hypothetical protein
MPEGPLCPRRAVREWLRTKSRLPKRPSALAPEVKCCGTKAVTTPVATAVVVEHQLCDAVSSSHDAT